IRNDDRSTLRCGGAADAASERDLETPHGPLIRANAKELRRDDAVEPGPEMTKAVLDQRARGRHSRNIVIDSGHHLDQVRIQPWIRTMLRLVAQVEKRFRHRYRAIQPANCRSMSSRASP